MRKTILLATLITLVILAIPGALLASAAWDRVRSEPLDASAVRERLGIQVPRPIVRLVKRESLAYEVHAQLGSLIHVTGGDPEAAAVQWLKASAHVRSDQDLDRAVAGLEAAKERTADVTEFQVTICQYVENGSWDGHQREAMTGAGLSCPLPSRRR